MIHESIPKFVRSRIPEQVRSITRPKYVAVRDFLLDPLEYLGSNLAQEITPPRYLIRKGGYRGNVSHFRQEGKKQLGYCVKLGSLKPDGKTLEVGCGMGRLAGALTRYVSKTGMYEGLDTNQVGVGWCQRKITAKYPNFRFHAVDVYNKGYNPNGKIPQSKYRFPYNDESFDLAFSYSVFTHMIMEDVAHYLSEMSRVLKTGGICINSLLVLNADSSKLVEAGQTHFNLKDRLGRSYCNDKDHPETIIAHDEAEVRSAYSSAGLQLTQPIRYGAWAASRYSLEGQDIIVARK